MKDGMIYLSKCGKGLVARAIKHFTGMPYCHVAGYLQGFTFESTVWWGGIWWRSGIRLSIGGRQADEVWQPKTDLTIAQCAAMLRYFVKALDERRPYNVGKLLVLAIVYPTRWFWEKVVKWVPFDKDWHGEVCSTVWDEAYKAAGVDLLPGQREGYTVPGSFRKSPMLEQVGV